MTRRVVFAGGVQAKALARAYRLDIAVDRDEDVFFIGAESVAREAAHRVIAAADIVITDVSDAGETVPERLVPSSAERIAVPIVYGAFLWPFAGRAHPRNRGIDALPGGPYPADFGDSFLDRMLAEHVPEDEAIRRYLALDVADEADLDGLFAHTMARQARLDAHTGFDIAGFIGSQFRSQNLFATRERLRLPLFQHVAATVLDRMGVGAAKAQLLLEAPFAPGAMPIHPAVLRHYGMQAPLPDHRYPVLDEGLFTFEQYCRRYLRYEWNERLHVAMALAETNPAEAIPALRLALDISPGSRAGHDALDEAERLAAESSHQSPLALSAPGQDQVRERAAEHDQAAPPSAPVIPLRPAAPASRESVYASPDAPLPPDDQNPGLIAAALPAKPVENAGPAEPGAPVFAESSFASLRFPPAPAPAGSPELHDNDDDDETQASPLSVFAAPARPAAPPLEDPDATAPAEQQEQQAYVELPLSYFGHEEPVPLMAAEIPDRFTPLPPAAELIEVLPRMLSSTRALAGTADSPFAAMPETMPPPPLRPVLPPELQPEHEKRGLISKLFGAK